MGAGGQLQGLKIMNSEIFQSAYLGYNCSTLDNIRESVDSLCWDGADMY